MGTELPSFAKYANEFCEQIGRELSTINIMRSRLPCLLLLWSVLAHADEDERCFAAAAAGQKFEKAGKLRDATEQLRVCARAECPTEVSSTCTTFLTRVDGKIPDVRAQRHQRAGC
jgi:hypothetical protein